MLIRPADAARSDAEWRTFLRSHDFGQLIATSPRDVFPIVIPLHFTYEGGDEVLCHLARSNPIWPALEESGQAMLSVIGAYSYITSTWNTPPGRSITYGIPTSYYAAVQIRGRIEIVDDAEGIADILNRQMAHFEPDGPTEPASTGNDYARSLTHIRAICLRLDEVQAKFKFGGNRSPQHQREISEALRERGRELDMEASQIQLRRLSESDTD